jgi:hypothetical protein
MRWQKQRIWFVTNELKNCPFCGWEIFLGCDAETSADTEAICCVYDGEDDAHYFECPQCETQGPKADTPEDAAEGWNTRTPSPALAAQPTAKLPDDVREVLGIAKDALAAHACHGEDAPCRRSASECKAECGYDAGKAFICIAALLSKGDAA